MFGVLVNVASSSQNPNGRGCIFEDNTFEYLPIPEDQDTTERIPTYLNLGFNDKKFPDLRVHVDPEFQTFTYGHIKRGFGDTKAIAQLKKEDALFFYATLQRYSGWSPYIIGYFMNLRVHDCSKLSTEEIKSLKSEGFENNAHLKRIDPHVDFLVKGGYGSRLLDKACALAEKGYPLKIKESLKDIILTVTQKKIDPGKPWHRWTLICTKPEEFLLAIQETN